MQNPTELIPIRLMIKVATGDRKNAGTNATVKIKVTDKAGYCTEEFKLSRFGRDDHKRGHVDSFPVPATQVPAGFTETATIEFWRDKFGAGDSWYLDLVTVEDLIDHKSYYFPVHRWIDASTRYKMNVFDTALSQFDDNPNRPVELERKRKAYTYTETHPGLPVQVKDLPEDEKFSDSYQFDLGKLLVKLKLDTNIINLQSHGQHKPNWESFDEIRGEAYKFSMDLPMTAKPQYWPSDVYFGLQRVQGCNPVMIRLCEEAPANLGFEPSRIEEILGSTLEAAIAAKRIFFIDLKVLENVTCRPKYTIGAPIALFYLTKEKDLLPLAIQLQQKPSPTNPVFYPTDEPNAWTLAKMWYNNADASYHQSCTHLSFTHLLMEGISVCANRHLSPSHPMFKLLAPHFLYIMAINQLAVEKLINSDGWVSRATNIGVGGLVEISAQGAAQWHLEKDAVPAADCAYRKVFDPEVLPNYPYREDAIKIYDAISTYVSAVVKRFYLSADHIAKDKELQDFGKELVAKKGSGGVGIQGVPGNGTFNTVDQIITTMSAIIFTCSVGHAAANFNQYDEYGFPPNYPILMPGQLPDKKDGFTEKDIIQCLQSKKETLDTMTITRLLSTKGTNSLGDFEVQYLYDPASVEAAVELRKRLHEIGNGIRKRNNDPKVKFEYGFLNPEGIPNAISI